MTPTRDDIALYVSGNYDGDTAALEAAIAADAGLAQLLAEEAELELVLRDAAASAAFCPACDDIVRGERCNGCGAAMRPGGYTVERVLVSNAHGRMYVAHDADGKRVALKELAFVHTPAPAAVAAFEREAKFLRALSHPAIPRFLASFEEGQGVHTRYYLAQELVEGTALDKLDDKWYTEAEIVDIAKQVLVILEYLQSLSPMVIHRDIKPANLIVRADKTIALVDFGAAHAHGTTAGVTTIGTFGYMPIEQLAGIVDATTDLYALGASLLHLLTRQEPWKLAQNKTTVNVSAPLRTFLDKLTAPDPKDRFPSAKEAMAALENREQLTTKGPKPARSGRARRIVISAVAATAVAAGGAAMYEIGRSESPSNERSPRQAADYSATLRMSMPPGVSAILSIDGMRAATVTDGTTITMTPGEHTIRLVGDNGTSCVDSVKLEPNKTTTVQCSLASPDHSAKVRLSIPPGVSAKLYVDGKEHTAGATDGMDFPLPPGEHMVKLVGDNGGSCQDLVTLEATKTTTIQCMLAPPAAPAPRLDTKKRLSKSFNGAALNDVMHQFSQACGLNIVLPDHISAKVTGEFADVPCDQTLEVILESYGLWYEYRPESRLVRVAPRKELDAEAEAAIVRRRVEASLDPLAIIDDTLPKGVKVDLDVKDAPLRDVLRMISASANVNVVVPDFIGGKVTIRVKGVPWEQALEAVLASHGLWYRYRSQGKLVRVAPRKELDAEVEAAVQRSQRR